jgi:hypothetical protein
VVCGEEISLRLQNAPVFSEVALGKIPVFPEAEFRNSLFMEEKQ